MNFGKTLRRYISLWILSMFLISNFGLGPVAIASGFEPSTLAQEPGSQRQAQAEPEAVDREAEALAIQSIAELIRIRNAPGTDEAARQGIEGRIAEQIQLMDGLHGGRYSNQVIFDDSVVHPNGRVELYIQIVDSVEQVPPRTARYTVSAQGVLTPFDEETVSQFGEHDPEVARHVRALLANKTTITSLLAEDALALLQAAVAQIPPVAQLDLEGIPAERSQIDNFTDAGRSIAEAVVVDDPENSFLVVFVEGVPVFEKSFFDFLVTAGLNDVIAQILRHEDLEPRLRELLEELGLLERFHPHEVVTDLQTQEAEPSVLGLANRLHDIALWYRASAGILTGPEVRVQARIVESVESARRQAPALLTEASNASARIASSAAAEAVLSVEGAVVMIGDQRITGRLAGVVRDAGMQARNFRRGLDLTWEGLMRFFARARILAQIFTARSQENHLERVFLGRKLQRLTKAPKAAVLDIDALVTINYADIIGPDGQINQDADITLDRAVVGISKALAEKIQEVKDAQGQLQFFVVSRQLPEWLLQGVLNAIDAGDENLLVSVAQPADTAALMETVQSKYDKTLDRENDVLFYLAPETQEAWAAELKDHKVIAVQRAATADERVSIAKLMVGLEYLYMDPAESRPTSLVTQILRDIIEQLYQQGGLTAEEYQALLPVTDEDTQFILFPPTKADNLTGQVEDMLRTSQAVKRYA